jgi:hypothetical protein
MEQFMQQRLEDCRPGIDVDVLSVSQSVEVPLRISQAALIDAPASQFVGQIV